MRFSKFKSWVAGLCVLALTACGGGGGSGDSVLGDGAGTPVLGSGNVGGPTLAVSISSSSVSTAAPATVTATLRAANGVPVAGAVVKFELGRTDLAQLGADSALTSSQGMASVGLVAINGATNGADTVKVTATLGTTTLSGQINYSVTSATANLQVSIDSTTLRVSTGPVRFSAAVRDASGQPVANQVVTFAAVAGVVRVTNPSGLTDALGVASTTVVAVDGSVGAADTVVAGVTVGGKALQSSLNVQVVSESPSISLFLDRTQIGSATPATVQAMVRDANNLPVASAIVSFASQFGLGTFSAATAATANVSGIATVALSPKSVSTAGADTVTASVTVNGVTKTTQQVVEFVTTVSAASPQMTLGISSPQVTPVTPAQLTLRVLNGAGQPVSGAVVTLSTTRGNLATLDAASVLTNASGVATIGLKSAASGISGADEVVARTTVQGVLLQQSVGFSVDSAAPVLRVDATDAPVLFSDGSVTVSATLRNSLGSTVGAGQLVRFAGGTGQLALSAATAITNASGVATVTARALNGSIAGAVTVTASATLEGRDLQATKILTLKAEAPDIALDVVPAPGSSVISAAAPATVRATVRNSAGALVPDALVSFSTGAGLGVFDLKTSATANQGADLGIAAVKLSPATTSTAGADTVVATVTVAGVQVSASKVVQLSASAAAVRSPILGLSLSSTSISSASPATVSATLTDSSGAPVPGQVVTFTVTRSLAITNIGTALTNPSGVAVAVISPATSSVAGADEVVARAKVAGVDLEASRGFQIQATDVTIQSFGPTTNLSAYGQTSLALTLTGAGVGSPVNIAISSACASQGKATVSPSTLTATSSPVTIQYRDNGCGAVQTADQLQAVIVGTDKTRSLSLGLTRPDVSSIAFVQAVPEAIFLKGSGFVETSVIRFEVRDGAGNPLPNQAVSLRLLTGAGGVTVQNNDGVSVGADTTIVRSTDAQGRVEIRVNAGTQPTPVRIEASLSPTVKTVSSNLSVGIGLPSQLNFSISQQTRNVEGMNIDGTANSYSIIASDRSGNPVPAGTSINFVTEGGQVESIRQTALAAGVARATAGFVSADPRPEDGRVTVTAYALGEESFIDQNGNNVYDVGEPFRDLGNIFKDRSFDGLYVAAVDETVPTNIANSSACVAPAAASGATALTNALLATDASIPSLTNLATCDGVWSGAGKVYVRRAIETVLSTSATRLLWAGTAGLGGCATTTLHVGSAPTAVKNFAMVQSDTYYFGSGSNMAAGGALSFIVGDANTYRAGSPFRVNGAVGRLNPVAAGSTITASTPTDGLQVRVGGGSPVPSTSEASTALVGVTFQAASSGVVFVTVTSPSGLATTYGINVEAQSKTAAGVVGSCSP